MVFKLIQRLGNFLKRHAETTVTSGATPKVKNAPETAGNTVGRKLEEKPDLTSTLSNLQKADASFKQDLASKVNASVDRAAAFANRPKEPESEGYQKFSVLARDQIAVKDEKEASIPPGIQDRIVKETVDLPGPHALRPDTKPYRVAGKPDGFEQEPNSKSDPLQNTAASSEPDLSSGVGEAFHGGSAASLSESVIPETARAEPAVSKNGDERKISLSDAEGGSQQETKAESSADTHKHEKPDRSVFNGSSTLVESSNQIFGEKGASEKADCDSSAARVEPRSSQPTATSPAETPRIDNREVTVKSSSSTETFAERPPQKASDTEVPGISGESGRLTREGPESSDGPEDVEIAIARPIRELSQVFEEVKSSVENDVLRTSTSVNSSPESVTATAESEQMGKSEAQKAPSTLKAAGSPKKAKAVKEPKTPKEPKKAKAVKEPKTPKEPKIPKEPRAPKGSKASKEAHTSEELKTSEEPKKKRPRKNIEAALKGIDGEENHGVKKPKRRSKKLDAVDSI